MSSHLIRSDLIPVVTGYVIVLVILAIGLWRLGHRVRAGLPLTRYAGRLDRGWTGLIWHMATDAVGGYCLLAGVVVLYYYFVAREGGSFLDSEFTGAALLLAIAFPIYLAGSWIYKRLRPPRGSGDGQPGDPTTGNQTPNGQSGPRSPGP
jgi:hypothetical protein